MTQTIILGLLCGATIWAAAIQALYVMDKAKRKPKEPTLTEIADHFRAKYCKR